MRHVLGLAHDHSVDTPLNFRLGTACVRDRKLEWRGSGDPRHSRKPDAGCVASGLQAVELPKRTDAGTNKSHLGSLCSEFDVIGPRVICP